VKHILEVLFYTLAFETNRETGRNLILINFSKNLVIIHEEPIHVVAV
jgi:hypothetical protein